MNPAIISALLPLGEKLFGGLASALSDSSPGQKTALSELLGAFMQKALSSEAAGGGAATAFSVDSQILQAFKALAEGHTIELEMTLKVRPKAG